MRCAHREGRFATGTEIGLESLRDAGVGLLDVVLEFT
jgi:hypothetical protein